MKRFLAMLLALVMVFSLAACGQQAAPAPAAEAPAAEAPAAEAPAAEAPVEEAAPPSYTYNTYGASLANNWNPHTWETNADSGMFTYLTSPLVDYTILNSEDGLYHGVCEVSVYYSFWQWLLIIFCFGWLWYI